MVSDRLGYLRSVLSWERFVTYLSVAWRDLSPPRGFQGSLDLSGKPLQSSAFSTWVSLGILAMSCTLLGSWNRVLYNWENSCDNDELKKHLLLAEEANDTVEKQRACTQLGRTYHEIFLRSEDDCDAIQSAKKYFKIAMELAQVLKEKPPPGVSSSFLEEYINAHNNIGLLDYDLDNPDGEARTILEKGLQICDEEEVSEYDATRSRLHHNLGNNVFMELRSWEEAKKHIEMDINICHKINHSQGEAKGYINLAELHNKTQKYDDALLCYGKASTLAKSMQDESALVEQIEQNIKTVKKAIKCT